jgi:molybdenum cofactor cytidylyltransferase
MNKEIAIIILAAGSSSRMGQPKQQLVIADKPLLVRSIETALNVGTGKVVVVLGSEAPAHRVLLQELPVDIVLNQNWQNGMGSSIKAGLKFLIETFPEMKAVIVMVCDQPLLKPAHLQALISKYEETGKPVVSSAYAHTLGVPALFDHSQFEKILQLQDDRGAKQLLDHEQAENIDFPDGAVDLDTPEDYNAFTSFPG